MPVSSAADVTPALSLRDSDRLNQGGASASRGEIRILFIGDIVGKPGRKAVSALLPLLKQEYGPDVVMANVENLAHGKGMTTSTLGEMVTAGIQIGTGGNHTFSKPEANELLAAEPNILVRPLNMPAGTPGKGMKTFTVSGKKVVVINLLGQHGMNMEGVDSPFATMEQLRRQGLPEADAIIVDLHAETTSEKVCLGWYLDGLVSAVLGTHTHVPTADARVLPKGTAYITDVGMTGLRDSSLGVDKDISIQRFLTGQRLGNEIPDGGLVTFSAVLIDIDHGQATSIQPVYREISV